MRVAIEGCCHGELDSIYKTLQQADEQAGQKTDLLLICGDFQAVRNHADLQSLAVPQKYRRLGDFHKYYSGEAVAPVLTIIIGGNHEASNYMWELFHGGWVAPSIYFLGHAGSVLVNGLRISGASGIYKQKDYKRGHFERLPYDNDSMRSIYHIREFNVVRLMLLARARPEIFLSHDWPLSIEQHGDLGSLLRFKPFFRQEVESNTLGSPPLYGLLRALAPTYWFAAHLHVKYAALFKHDGSQTQVQQRQTRQFPQDQEKVAVEANPEEIALEVDEDAPAEAEDLAAAKKAALAMLGPDDPSTVEEAPALKAVPKADVANEDEIVVDLEGDDDDDEPTVAAAAAAPPAPVQSSSKTTNEDEIELDLDEEDQPAPEPEQPASRPQASPSDKNHSQNRETRFLALSKCAPRQHFLQILDFNTPTTQVPPQMTFDPLWLAIVRSCQQHLNLEPRVGHMPQDMAQLNAAVDESLAWMQANLKDGGSVPVEEVQQFVQTAPSPASSENGSDGSTFYMNPQTQALCEWLGIENNLIQ